MKKSLKLFAQIAKIDESRREVWGVATSEAVDKDGEIFDYETSKPYFKAWSDEIAKATDGKSLGNVREMHEPRAVGKLVEIGFDDQLKEIRVAARIIDDPAWRKCTQGVYTGFSIGGSYVKAWKEGEFTRYTAKPAEISVVDNPCNPGAHFTAVKADGTWEVRKFAATLPTPSASQAKTPTARRHTYKGAESMEKIGAKHSAETQAHHDAINKCMSKIAQACGEAQDHVSALMGKEEAESAARPAFTKNNSVAATSEAEIEKAGADSSSAIAKVAELEQSVAGLRAEMKTNLDELAQAVANLTEAVTRLSGGDMSASKAVLRPTTVHDAAQRAARTAVRVFTVSKEDDGKPDGEEEHEKSVHELLKQTFQNPQRASNYLR